MKFCSYILVVLMSINSVLLGQDYWTFESRSKVLYVNNIASAPLKIKAPKRFNHKFASKVGGVSFEETLLTTANIMVDYDKSKDDGNRLEVVVNGTSYYPIIPDWQLAPIANFASTEYTAAVSLFGNDSTVQVGYNEVVYHDAFENTLLGLRLLQADIMLLNIDSYYTLPRRNGNDIIYGEGERSIAQADTTDIGVVKGFMEYYRGQFESWIFTDKDKILTINDIINQSESDEELPYYYFWKTGYPWNAEISARVDSLNVEYKETLDKPLGEYILNSSVLNEEDVIEKMSDFTFILSMLMESYQSDLASIYNSALKDSIITPRLIELEEVNQASEIYIYPTLRSINPAVYQAAENTMKFSALFRYVKEQNPLQWQQFMNKIKTVKIEPAVVTPTVFNRSLK